MSKRLILLLCIILLASNCRSPKRIRSRVNLFPAIAADYDIGKYLIILKTADSLFYLKNAKVLPNGNITAVERNKPLEKKRFTLRNVSHVILAGSKGMFFRSNEVAANVIKRIVDSTGIDPDQVEFNNSSIIQVNTIENKKGPDKRHVVYDRLAGIKSFFKGLLFLVIICGVGLLILIGIVIFEIITNPPAAFGGGVICYIATMVYGSYEAPAVLVLRKFRDEKLAPYFWGKVFIRIYYSLSPFFVRVFKDNKPVNRMIKFVLDR